MPICPNCDREIRNPNQWHNCVRVSIGDHFSNKPAELELIFDKILATVMEWEDVAVSATQNCIVFVQAKTFLIVKPMKKQLDIKFYSATESNAYPILKSTLWNSKYENHIRLGQIEELTPQVFQLIRNSFLLCSEQIK